MTLEEKRAFIKKLMDDTTEHVLKAAEHMPEDWDGLEIREYLVEEMARNCVLRFSAGRGQHHRKRYLAFLSEMATRGGL